MTARLSTRFLCVCDWEATCWSGPRTGSHISEIIELGCVMLDARTFDTVGEFCTFVRPAQSSALSDFCTTLTSIRQQDVDSAPGFREAYSSMAGWISGYGTGGVLFVSYGLYDYKQLMKDCAFHGLPFPFRGDHLNLKEYVGDRMLWSKKGCGMGKALSRLGIQFVGRQHRGIDDAKMAARILVSVGYNPEAPAFGYRASARDVLVGYPRRD